MKEDLELFADDSFITRSKKDMEKALERITKWLKHSGLKVNQNKTEARCRLN
jgi:hypothetical protein